MADLKSFLDAVVQAHAFTMTLITRVMIGQDSLRTRKVTNVVEGDLPHSQRLRD